MRILATGQNQFLTFSPGDRVYVKSVDREGHLSLNNLDYGRCWEMLRCSACWSCWSADAQEQSAEPAPNSSRDFCVSSMRMALNIMLGALPSFDWLAICKKIAQNHATSFPIPSNKSLKHSFSMKSKSLSSLKGLTVAESRRPPEAVRDADGGTMCEWCKITTRWMHIVSDASPVCSWDPNEIRCFFYWLAAWNIWKHLESVRK